MYHAAVARGQQRRARLNTVYLSCEEVDGGFGARRPAVFGALDGVVGHLALDDARVGTLAARAE
jgi:hypothetical protein